MPLSWGLYSSYLLQEDRHNTHVTWSLRCSHMFEKLLLFLLSLNHFTYYDLIMNVSLPIALLWWLILYDNLKTLPCLIASTLEVWKVLSRCLLLKERMKVDRKGRRRNFTHKTVEFYKEKKNSYSSYHGARHQIYWMSKGYCLQMLFYFFCCLDFMM